MGCFLNTWAGDDKEAASMQAWAVGYGWQSLGHFLIVDFRESLSPRVSEWSRLAIFDLILAFFGDPKELQHFSCPVLDVMRMKRDVTRYVESCLTCLKVKAEHQKSHGKMQPLEIPM
ncbi:hypothetical protein OSB04_016751 [Centaurea solstitialis]|uniref:Uncharacterized protein n=1 Tax=Centaurea solstitialis TaxID=347529 RepID=A0AA38TES8_9ASTR|nr:hypothetical protein OSB04_016751 [Centaurea solstitialis]